MMREDESARREPGTDNTRISHDEPRRILVLANETCAGSALFDELRYRAGDGPSEVLVVAPALTSKMRYWVSDEDKGIAEARKRLAETIERCGAAGIPTRGEVGDTDPLQSLDDAMHTFAPDEVIIATHPPSRSNWLEEGLVAQARARFDRVPITHVVIDLEHETSAVEPETREVGARKEHSRRDMILVSLAGFLMIIATFFTITFYAIDVPSWLLITWVVVIDFGTKLFGMWLLWMLFQRRPRADRLDF